MFKTIYDIKMTVIDFCHNGDQFKYILVAEWRNVVAPTCD